MNERSCNSDRDMLRRAIEKIRRDEKHRPKCCMIVGPTGPIARFNNSSNKIIHNFKRIPFKSKKKTSQMTCFYGCIINSVGGNFTNAIFI